MLIGVLYPLLRPGCRRDSIDKLGNRNGFFLGVSFPCGDGKVEDGHDGSSVLSVNVGENRSRSVTESDFAWRTAGGSGVIGTWSAVYLILRVNLQSALAVE